MVQLYSVLKPGMVWILILLVLCRQVDAEASRAPSCEAKGAEDCQNTIAEVPPADCALWYAESTLPSSGYGIFAGRDFAQYEALISEDDVVIPIFAMRLHDPNRSSFFLWNEYTWDPYDMFMAHEGTSIRVASPGFGSLPNGVLDFFNVRNMKPHHDYAGLHRSRDTGTGAFSPYTRGSSAYTPVKAGDELFVDYGEQYFTGRKDQTKRLLPRRGDRATSRSLGELANVGTCMDNFAIKASTIKQAGKGAFAKRPLREGRRIAVLPLIHIGERKRLNFYKVVDAKQGIVDHSTITGQQLLLNYCFGHSKSTLLLCPYGLHTSFINHGANGTANVRLQWSTPERSNHNSSWLDRTPLEIGKETTAGLAMEVVATRDINVGEEVLMDYGNEWETAWERHASTWDPPVDNYVSAFQLNKDIEKVLRSEFEMEKIGASYPPNVQLKVNKAFGDPRQWKTALARNELEWWMHFIDSEWAACDIQQVEIASSSGERMYTARTKGKTETVMRNLPHSALRFFDKPFTSDIHLASAFRYPITIPDDMLPQVWLNVPG